MSNRESDGIDIDVSHARSGGSDSVHILRANYESAKRRRRMSNAVTLVSLGLLVSAPGGILLIKCICFDTCGSAGDRLGAVAGM